MDTLMKIRNKIIIWILFLFFAAVWIYPIIKAIIRSLAISGFNNYVTVWTFPKVNVPMSIVNSFIIAISVAVINTIIVSLAGYAFSKMRFWGKNFIYYAFLLCLTIPTAAIITPLFNVSKTLGLINTNQAVILPLLFLGAPFALLIYKNFVDTVPDALLEAPKIDGANSFKVFLYIIVPLTRVGIINIAILAFIGAWNEFMIPLVLISKVKNYPVTLATNYFSGGVHQTPEMVAQLYAALVIMCIPTMFIYIFCQKYMQEGLTAGAIKG